MNVAIVPAFDAVVLEWLGGSTVLHRALSKVCNVRGIDQVLVVTGMNQEGVQGIAESFSDPRVRLFRIQEPIEPMLRMCRLLHRNDSTVTYVAVNPLYPFLDGGKIEKTLHVMEEDTNGKLPCVTCTGRWSLAPAAGNYEVTAAAGFVDACVGVVCQPNDPLKIGEAGRVGKSYHFVPIDSIEAVDISTQPGRKIAACLVDQGQP